MRMRATRCSREPRSAIWQRNLSSGRRQKEEKWDLMLMMPVGLPHRLSLRSGLSIHDAGNRRRLCTQLRHLLRRLARDCHCSRRQSRFSLQVLNSWAPRQMWCQCSVLRLFSLPPPCSGCSVQISHSWAQLRILAAARDAQLLHAGVGNGTGGSG